jgi:hypothetical protein
LDAHPGLAHDIRDAARHWTSLVHGIKDGWGDDEENEERVAKHTKEQLRSMGSDFQDAGKAMAGEVGNFWTNFSKSIKEQVKEKEPGWKQAARHVAGKVRTQFEEAAGHMAGELQTLSGNISKDAKGEEEEEEAVRRHRSRGGSSSSDTEDPGRAFETAAFETAAKHLAGDMSSALGKISDAKSRVDGIWQKDGGKPAPARDPASYIGGAL